MDAVDSVVEVLPFAGSFFRSETRGELRVVVLYSNYSLRDL